jgi:hypothetical protein
MQKVWMVAVVVALVLGLAGTNQAQDIRLPAYALQCFVPTIPGLHTRASLVGKITLENRTVRFVANCFDGFSASQFPDVQVNDGEVQSIDLSVVSFLENGNQQVVAQNHCSSRGRNGFLTFRCLASDAPMAGEVNIMVSIPSLDLQVLSSRTTP